jgi:hypothetical protein
VCFGFVLARPSIRLSWPLLPTPWCFYRIKVTNRFLEYRAAFLTLNSMRFRFDAALAQPQVRLAGFHVFGDAFGNLNVVFAQFDNIQVVQIKLRFHVAQTLCHDCRLIKR